MDRGSLTFAEFPVDVRDEPRVMAGAKAAISDDRKVFDIRGHDEAERRELEATIRRFKLEPVVLRTYRLAGPSQSSKSSSTTPRDGPGSMIE